MRLVDADALLVREKLHNMYPTMDHYCLSVKAVKARDIEFAPTVDPVRHEYWIKYESGAFNGYNEFGEMKIAPRWFYRCHGCRKGSVVRSAFCPCCGAKMDAEEP